MDGLKLMYPTVNIYIIGIMLQHKLADNRQMELMPEKTDARYLINPGIGVNQSLLLYLPGQFMCIEFDSGNLRDLSF